MKYRIPTALLLAGLALGAFGCKSELLLKMNQSSLSPSLPPLVPNGESAHATSAEAAWRFDGGRVTLLLATGSVPSTADISVTKQADQAGFLPDSVYAVETKGELAGSPGLILKVDPSRLDGMAFSKLGFYEKMDADLWKTLPSSFSMDATPSFFVYASLPGPGVYGVKPKDPLLQTPQDQQDESGLEGVWLSDSGDRLLSFCFPFDFYGSRGDSRTSEMLEAWGPDFSCARKVQVLWEDRSNAQIIPFSVIRYRAEKGKLYQAWWTGSFKDLKYTKRR